MLKLLYAIPNGGDRNLRVARKLKAEGVLAGVADLCLPAARRGHHGLYLEMKSEEGVTTKEQKEFLCGVSAEGYCAVIAQGVDEARAVLEWYIGITEHEPPSVLKTNLICQSHISGRQRGPKRRSDQRENYVLLTGDGRRPAVPKQSKWPFAVILITPPASNLEELHHAG